MDRMRDTVIKKIIKILIICSLMLSVSFSVEETAYLSFNDSAAVISYQQNKNREIQHLLDRVYGVERVMIDIKVNVTKKEEVLSQPTNLLLPGVPNQVIEPPRVGTVYYLNGYDIGIWIAPDVRDQKTVEDMVKDVMEFNKYPLSTIVVNRALDKRDKPFDFFNQATIEGIKEIMNTININIKIPEVNAAINAAVSSNSSLNAGMKTQMDINNLIVIIIGFLVIIIVVVLLIVVFGRAKKEVAGAGGAKGDGDDAKGTAATLGGAAAAGAQGGLAGLGNEISLDVSHKQAGDDDEMGHVIKSELFTFVDESNIFKLAFILQQEKPKGKAANIDEYWQNVAIIVSFLPSHLSRIIFMKYTIEEQSEIIPYLAYEIDYPIEQIQELEKQFNEKLANLVLVGGKRSVMPILDKFSNQKKSELAKQLSEKHPDVLTEIRDMIILFEDLTLLPKDSLTKLLMEVDPNILALCFINMPEDERNDIFSELSEGLRAMINEVIDLRKDNYTDVEVQDATDTLISQAKALNRKGIIKLNLTGFGEQDGAIDQQEIDKLFDDN